MYPPISQSVMDLIVGIYQMCTMSNVIILSKKSRQNNVKFLATRSSDQGTHRLEKYLNLEGFLEKSLKSKSALKSTGKSLKSLEKSLNSTIFCRT